MGSDILLRAINESEYTAWKGLLTESVQGSVYALPEYLDTLCRATGGRFSLLGVFRGDELVGGVPLYEETGPAGAFISSRLLLYYSGIVLKPLATRYPSKATSKYLEVLGMLAQMLSDSTYARIILTHPGLIDARPFIQRGWIARPGYTYVVPISDIESVWGRIDQNLRRLINRCGESGVTLTDDNDFDSFYALHAQTHDRKGAYLPAERPLFGIFQRTQNSRLGATVSCATERRPLGGRTTGSFGAGRPIVHCLRRSRRRELESWHDPLAAMGSIQGAFSRRIPNQRSHRRHAWRRNAVQESAGR